MGRYHLSLPMVTFSSTDHDSCLASLTVSNLDGTPRTFIMQMPDIRAVSNVTNRINTSMTRTCVKHLSSHR